MKNNIQLKKPKPWEARPTPNKDGTPSTFYVETVLACNLDCPECVIGADAVTRTKKIMKLEEFKIISKKIEPYAKLVFLHKWGEPFMNKNIFEMIKMTSEYAHAHISTNAHFLDGDRCEKTIKSGLGTLIISIDGMSQEVYEKYRVRGDVKLVIENIKRVAKTNEHYGKPVTILPQFIAFDHNYHEIGEFEDFCSSLGLRAIIKKPYIRYGKMEVSKDKKYHMEKYKNAKEHLDAISTCLHSDTIMAITADGSLLLCTQDYNQGWSLGNLLDENVDVVKLWNNPLYKKIRDSIKNKQPPEICTKKCMIYNAGYKVT